MLLYEINEAYQQLLDLDLEQEDFETAVGAIKMELEFKAENIVYVLKEFEGSVEALEKEIKRLKGKRDSINKKVESLKSYLSTSMLQMDIDKINTSLFTINFRKSSKVEINDLNAIPKEYIKEKVELSADKTALKKALSKGNKIEGCHIQEYKNLQIK